MELRWQNRRWWLSRPSRDFPIIASLLRCKKDCKRTCEGCRKSKNGKWKRIAKLKERRQWTNERTSEWMNEFSFTDNKWLLGSRPPLYRLLVSSRITHSLVRSDSNMTIRWASSSPTEVFPTWIASLMNGNYAAGIKYTLVQQCWSFRPQNCCRKAQTENVGIYHLKQIQSSAIQNKNDEIEVDYIYSGCNINVRWKHFMSLQMADEVFWVQCCMLYVVYGILPLGP